MVNLPIQPIDPLKLKGLYQLYCHNFLVLHVLTGKEPILLPGPASSEGKIGFNRLTLDSANTPVAKKCATLIL